MPTYEYRCESCKHQFEVFASMSDPDPETCEECGAQELKKVLFPVAVHYKGSGFYSTDYSGKKSSGAGSSGGESSSAGESSSSGGSDSSASAGSTDSGSSTSSTGSSGGSSGGSSDA
jgi:putative FmdB family regulatory protein